MLNVVITEIGNNTEAGIMGYASIAEAKADIEFNSKGAERVIAFVQFDTDENPVLSAIHSLCCVNSEEDRSFCQEFENMLAHIFVAGTRHGMDVQRKEEIARSEA